MQFVFTTHSDNALEPLPPEAIWASLDGKIQQGKLSVEVLRAISGRVETNVAVFVEDDFAKSWLEAVFREKLGMKMDMIVIYPVGGDSNCIRIHESNLINPAITFNSFCYIDGDSLLPSTPNKGIFKLPGANPELTVFNSVLSNINNNIAMLTLACQRSASSQKLVEEVVREVSITNRDPHVLFAQVGIKLGFIPEAIVRGAFLTVWMSENLVCNYCA